VERFSFRRFFIALIAFVIVLAVGTVGFVLLMGGFIMTMRWR